MRALTLISALIHHSDSSLGDNNIAFPEVMCSRRGLLVFSTYLEQQLNKLSQAELVMLSTMPNNQFSWMTSRPRQTYHKHQLRLFSFRRNMMSEFGFSGYWSMFKARGIRLPINYLLENHCFDFRFSIAEHNRLFKEEFEDSMNLPSS